MSVLSDNILDTTGTSKGQGNAGRHFFSRTFIILGVTDLGHKGQEKLHCITFSGT